MSGLSIARSGGRPGTYTSVWDDLGNTVRKYPYYKSAWRFPIRSATTQCSSLIWKSCRLSPTSLPPGKPVWEGVGRGSHTEGNLAHRQGSGSPEHSPRRMGASRLMLGYRRQKAASVWKNAQDRTHAQGPMTSPAAAVRHDSLRSHERSTTWVNSFGPLDLPGLPWRTAR
jgi:hypothetical protein